MDRPDFELPWMLDPDRREVPGARPRLDKTNLFLLLLREAFKDGSISRVENKLMGQFSKALGIPSKQARQLGKLVKTEVVHGKLQGSGECDLREVFRKACHFAAADGEVDAGERSLLASFGRGIDVPEAELDVMLEDAMKEVSLEGGAPHGAPEASAASSTPTPDEPAPDVPTPDAPDAPPREDGIHLDVEIPDFTIQFGDL